VPAGSQRFVSSTTYGDETDGHMTLRLLHVSTNLRPFSSEYDLVQVIPIFNPTDGQSSAALTMAPLPVSDVNFDGVINDADVDDFLTGWFEDAPIADIDMSTAIDQADVDAFVEAYVNGG
jgi:hypothetical protein